MPLSNLCSGSQEARDQGCICDPQDPPPDAEGRRRYNVEKMCPIHGLAEVRAALNDYYKRKKQS